MPVYDFRGPLPRALSDATSQQASKPPCSANIDCRSSSVTAPTTASDMCDGGGCEEASVKVDTRDAQARRSCLWAPRVLLLCASKQRSTSHCSLCLDAPDHSLRREFVGRDPRALVDPQHGLRRDARHPYGTGCSLRPTMDAIGSHAEAPLGPESATRLLAIPVARCPRDPTNCDPPPSSLGAERASLIAAPSWNLTAADCR